MKTIRMLILPLLLLGLLLALCACGQKPAPSPTPVPVIPTPEPTPAPTEEPTPLSPFVGDYVGYSAYKDGQYIRMDGLDSYTVTLDEDGKGALDWGERGGSGPISEWGTKGDGLIIKAGVSVMDVTVKDGALYIELGDGLAVCFIHPGADTSAMPLIDPKDLGAKQAEKPVPGTYYPYAMDDGEYCIRTPNFGAEEDGKIVIGADGSFLMATGEFEERYTWSVEDGQLILTDAAGNGSRDYMHISVPTDGIFSLEYFGQGAVTYYATAEADVSALDTITADEYLALTGNG